MMTTIQTAIKEAGLALPGNQRIWMWLKDNPDSTGAKIASVLKIPANNVATLCANLIKREMMESKKVSLRCRAGKGFTMRDVTVYNVNPKMETYELWPLPKDKMPPKAKPPKVAPVPEPMATPGEFKVVPEPTWTPEEHCMGLSLGHCRELHDYLKLIFGDSRRNNLGRPPKKVKE